MFGNEGWRWVGSPQPPTPGKVVALGDRAAGAGPLSAEWGRGGQGPEARAPRLRSGPGSPAAVSSAWIPAPPFLRPGRCLRPARPAQPPALAAARVQPPSGRVITVSPPDQTAAGRRWPPLSCGGAEPRRPSGLVKLRQRWPPSRAARWGRARGSHSPSLLVLRGPPGARLSAAARPGRPAAGL